MTDILTHLDSRRARFGRTLWYFPTGERVEARGVIASALALGALAAGATAGGQIAAGAIGSRAQGKAAERQTQAATDAANVEDQAVQRAEVWAREQAQQKWAASEADRRANYDQWAARQHALNTFRQKHGYGATEIPGYVPSQNPSYNPANTGGDGTSTTMPVPTDDTDPRVALQRPPASVGGAGAVGAYLPQQRTAYQSYAGARSSPRTVEDYLRQAR